MFILKKIVSNPSFFLLAFACAALSLFFSSATVHAAPSPGVGSSFTTSIKETNRTCLKACAAKLATCFAAKPATLTANGSVLDECRSAANTCVTSCNVKGQYTVSCEDRCATALQGCMVQAAKSQTDLKPACHASNKSCLLKACRITATQLAVDYCPKQCTRGSDICVSGGGMTGVDCTNVKNICTKACPTQKSSLSGGSSLLAGRSTMQLRSDFDNAVTLLRSFDFDFKTYNLSLQRLSKLACPDNTVVCEKTYEKCVALFSQMDQEFEHQLFVAKNECIQTCDEQPDSCFGLTKQACKPKEEKTCSCVGYTAGTQACKADGSGYSACVCKQSKFCEPSSKVSCTCSNEKTGQKSCATDGLSYGSCDCEAAPVTPPTTGVCTGTAPTCSAGYTGSYACVNGSWVSQCSLIKECTPGTSQTAQCYTSGGGLPGLRTDTCNANGKWVYGECVAANTACTSFTYSSWSACANGQQTRTVLTASPAGCGGGNPVLTQACTVACQGSQPSCASGYTGSYTCQNGQWVSGCVSLCQTTQPSCPAGWSGSFSCMPSQSSGVWMNTCYPVMSDSCYRGVVYRNVSVGSDTCPTCRTFGKCVGSGEVKNGAMCYLNTCGPYQPWSNFQNEASFKAYVDTIYNSVPNSCNPSFKYTQC